MTELYEPGSTFKILASYGPAIDQGLVGLGTIGLEIAKIAQAFGCDVCYYSTSGNNSNSEFKRVSFKEALQCDIISIHAPLNENTKNLFDANALNQLKDGTMLVNSGRGGIIDEEKIAQIIDEREIYFVNDVLEKEPIRADHPLLKVKNKDRLMITPHIAWASVEARKKLIELSAKNIEDFINLAKNESGKEFDINGVFYAVKVYDKVVLQRRKEKEEFVRKIKVGETLETEDWKITVKTVSQYVKKTSNNIAVFDAGLLKGPFTVRYRKDGDKMAPLGLDGRKKLSDIFSDAKIESIKRDFIPLVEFNGEILYLCGLRQSSHFKADKYTKDYLIIEYYYKGMRKNEY